MSTQLNIFCTSVRVATRRHNHACIYGSIVDTHLLVDIRTGSRFQRSHQTQYCDDDERRDADHAEEEDDGAIEETSCK